LENIYLGYPELPELMNVMTKIFSPGKKLLEVRAYFTMKITTHNSNALNPLV